MPMKAHEVMLSIGIEKCPECHCNVNDDWSFVDSTCKTVVECPQCGEQISTEINGDCV